MSKEAVVWGIGMSTEHDRETKVVVGEIENSADLLMLYFKQLGIDKVFGIPGGPLEPFCNALSRAQQRDELEVVTACHEAGAAYMAQAYGEASNTLGVCFVTTGPGVSNVITAMASAYAEEVPLLLISAQNSLASMARRPFQDSGSCGVDSLALLSACTRYNAMVTHVEQLERHLVNAVQKAFSDPPGPVHLSIPANIFASICNVAMPSYDLAPLLVTQAHLNTQLLDDLVTQLSSSMQSVFLLGEGIDKRGEDIVALAEAIGASVVTTPAAKGYVDNSHACYHGVCGFAGHRSANEKLKSEDSDLIVIIGCGLDEWDLYSDADSIFKNKNVVQDEVASHLHNSPMVSQHIFSCIDSSVQYLCDALVSSKKSDGQQHLDRIVILSADRDPESFFNSAESGFPDKERALVHPRRLMLQLSHERPDDSVIFTDIGNSSAWGIHYLVNRRSKQLILPWFRTSTRFAAMGWGIAQSIGHAFAQTKRKTICIVGDGSMLMSGQELAVAQQHGLNILFVVLNDASFGMVEHGQRMNEAESIAHELPKVDFSMLAKAQGVRGIRINNEREFLQLQWQELFSTTAPLLLDVCIDTAAQPPISLRTKMIKEGHADE
jgi:acetolactate synthase-1/2/3 large subunit